MGLQGTIKDFALPDIFQLIGMQRKTGILTLASKQDTVTIKFLEGQVVGAETKAESLEDRLGSVLVRTGRITQAQLEEALETQRNTLQRLGHILVKSGRISEEELVEALMVQSTQIIYRLFRWTEADYDFDQVENLDYDQSHFVPISSENILMEGARMVDEWPIIRRRIRSETMVLRKTDAAGSLDPEVESILTDDIEFNLDFDPDAAAEEAESEDDRLTVSPEERDILALVDGERTVREICDLLTLGEFDTFRNLSEMMTRQLVEEVKTAIPAARGTDNAKWGSKIGFGAAIALLSAWSLAGLASLPNHPFTPWRLLATTAATDHLRLYASMARLEKLEKAVQVFYLDAGSFPLTTAVLAENGYLRWDDLEDPWGRPYQFQVSAGGYQLLGLNAAGEPHTDLSISRRFNAVQRLITDGVAGEAP